MIIETRPEFITISSFLMMKPRKSTEVTSNKHLSLLQNSFAFLRHCKVFKIHFQHSSQVLLKIKISFRKAMSSVSVISVKT